MSHINRSRPAPARQSTLLASKKQTATTADTRASQPGSSLNPNSNLLDDVDEEELEMKVTKAPKEEAEELDFRASVGKETEEVKKPTPKKPVKAGSKRNMGFEKPKPLPEVRSDDILRAVDELKDIKDIIAVFDRYKPKNKNITIKDLKESEKSKIKKYKDCVYFGELLRANRHGKGIMFYNYDRVYEGEFEDDIKTGKGFEVLANGNTYEGEFKNGKPNGLGIFKWANGEVYEGEFRNGIKHGHGTWKGNKGDSYTGEWVNGKAEGKGLHIERNGDRYEGEIKGFLKHGYGTEIFKNGDKYVGNYINGKPDGYGEYYWANGCEYKGEFKNGLRHGKGGWKKSAKGSSDSYDGEWVNDKKCGEGVYEWASGNYYKGNYFDDMRNGLGEMHWTDGSTYKGMWEKGVQHGEGELSRPDKSPRRGVFVNNEFVCQVDKPKVFSTVLSFENDILKPDAPLVAKSSGTLNEITEEKESADYIVDRNSPTKDTRGGSDTGPRLNTQPPEGQKKFLTVVPNSVKAASVNISTTTNTLTSVSTKSKTNSPGMPSTKKTNDVRITKVPAKVAKK